MERAPYEHDLAGGLARAEAYWLRASDGIKLRAAIWPGSTPGDAKGTVLLFDGRTEFLEKYDLVAGRLCQAGYSVASLDWRGQGASDRLTPNPLRGHIGAFLDYQRDVAALLELVRAQDLPRPYYLIGHSMGGAIGLRAIFNELPVSAVVFSAPMWGIRIAPALRPLAWSLSWALSQVGLGHLLTPKTTHRTYVAVAGFDGNDLTTDPAKFAEMAAQVGALPNYEVGGPSVQWLNEGLRETYALSRLPAPAVPALTAIGAGEQIVDTAPIRAYMATWANGTLVEYPDAQHELLMERAEVSDDLLDRSIALFDSVPTPR